MSNQSSAKRLPDPRHASRNFWWLVFDGFVFNFGFTFISPASILPVFVARLTPIDLLAGAIPAIDFVGLALPQILGARWAARAARRGGRKRFVLIIAGIGRVPMLAPIVATAVYGDTEPGLVLASLLIGLGLFRLSEGLVLPAFFDIVGAVVPPPRRARYFALQQASGAVGGVASAFVARWLLANFPFPWGFVTCFALGTFFVSFVLVVFAQVREPEPDDPAWNGEGEAEKVSEVVSHPTWWRELAEVVSSDAPFRLLLVGRSLSALASMAPAYYTVSAVRRLGATDADGATFGAVMLAASLTGTLMWGEVAGRYRATVLVPIGAFLGASAALSAIFAPDVLWLLGTFVFVGLAGSALGMAETALPLALAERAGRSRARYVAVYSTLTVPLAVASPLIGGVIAGAYGYGPVNGIAIIAYAATAGVGFLMIRQMKAPMPAMTVV